MSSPLLNKQCLSFLIFKMQARLDGCLPEKGPKEGIRTCLKAFRPLIQVVFILFTNNQLDQSLKLLSKQACLMSLALWISFSRISDHFHHPLDVTVGAFVGILMVALLLLHCIMLYATWTTLIKQNLSYMSHLQAFVTMSFSRLWKEDHAFGRHYPEVQAIRL